MRSLLISLLVVLLAATIQAGVFKKEKVKLGKKNCLCDFNIEIGDTCSGSVKCDKKCSGSGTVELGGCSFTLAVKKGKGKISKCSCEAATLPVPTEPTIGPGSGETPVPMTGSGSGETPVPMTGSGSGETPVPIPTSPGSGSGGEGMQCSCKCNCPDGSGECDCDCNCPMTSKTVTCAPGFSAVCPMMGDMCPQDMDPICPHNAISRMGGNAAEGMDKGCQCVPDFLLAMVMIQPTGRMEAVDRAMTKATIQVGKKKCKCSYEMNAENCKKSKIVCDKKCSGKESGVELADGDVMYMVDIAVKKGKVTIAKCDVEAPEPTGTGGGSTGSGSGNGEGGMGGMVSRCACVSKGMGGSGPTVPTLPPTGSGSEPAPPTGSGSEPAPPTGSGSEPAPPTGSGSEPAPPTGSGSGSGPYVPGQPGGPWTEEEVEVTRERIKEMLNQENYKGFHIRHPQCSDSRVGLFVCDGSAFQFVKFDPTRSDMGNDNLSQLRRPKTSRVIQLGFHDCLKYKNGATDTAVDGCDGCLNWEGIGFEFKETWFVGNPDNQSNVNHFTKSYPIAHETGNNGLEGTVRALELIYTNTSWPSSARSLNATLKESGKSRADLWAFAATVALEMEIVRSNFACDIDPERQQTGILEGRDKCDIKLHRPIKFQYGRADCIPEEGQDAPYITSKAENHDNPWGHGDKVISNFNKDFGMTAEETIALMAAHGIQSRVHNKFLATKYAWIGTPYLSNVFFKQMAEKPMYGIDPDVDGFEKLNVVLSGDKEGKPVDNYGYKLVCTAMWNLTNPNGDDGPCYFKRQRNLGKNSVHRASSWYAAVRNFGPQLATDGFVSDYGWHYFGTQTEDNPWIELTLSSTKIITSITITMTVYGGVTFKNVEIRAGMHKLGAVSTAGGLIEINTLCAVFDGPGVSLREYTVDCSQPIEANYLSIQIKNEETYLQINEVQINDEPALESFAQGKPDDEFLRPMCFDTKRRRGNPNLDGEILKIPIDNTDENGETISGWWVIDPPEDCCDNATFVDIPGIKDFKIQQGGCKQVLSMGSDTHNFLMNFEMSMYQNFSINENNRPHGCRGLEQLDFEKRGEHNMVANENLDCTKNMKADFSSSGESYSQIIDRFSEDHDGWALEFLEGWDKMLRNGYSSGQLMDAPQAAWLGYNSWVKVTSDTEDFEEYILRNSPAIISNNTAENPTIMSSDRDTYRKECEYKSGMTNWNKNMARCPSGLFDP